jgi:hypothetical protein
MANIYQELSNRVEKGELTWQQILDEIQRIKVETEVCRQIANLEALVRFNTSTDVDTLYNSNDTHNYLHRKECWRKLSQDSKKVARIVLTASQRDWRANRFGQELYHKDKITRRRIDAVMRRYYKWSIRRVRKAFNELSQYCRDIE